VVAVVAHLRTAIDVADGANVLCGLQERKVMAARHPPRMTHAYNLQRANDLNAAIAPAGWPANQPSFDSVVEENLVRGLYLSHLNALVMAIRDPRLGQQHRLVLAEIVERTNAKTGMAYPGRAKLAEDITYYENGEPKRYSPATIAKAISELIKFGYVMVNRRAPVMGARALAHYVIVKPSIEELQARIAEACAEIRAKGKSDYKGPQQPAEGDGGGIVRDPDVTPGGNDDPSSPVTTGISVKTPDDDTGIFVSRPDGKGGGNVTPSGNIRADVTPVLPADGDTGVPTVTGNRTGRKNNTHLAPQLNLDAAPTTEPPAKAGSVVDAAFEDFWKAFPSGRKQDKGNALVVFRKIVAGKHIHKASAAALIEGARRYAVTKPDPKYTPMPTTWLNGGRWMDDLSDQRKRGSKYNAY
jgi:hypothetical protein